MRITCIIFFITISTSIFKLKLSPGLGETLIDEYESTGVIKPSLFHNLFIITAGDILSNPTTKFDSPMFADLLHKWKEAHETKETKS